VIDGGHRPEVTAGTVAAMVDTGAVIDWLLDPEHSPHRSAGR